MEPMAPEWVDTLLQAYATHDRITRFMLEGLPEAAWRAQPEAGRDIAGIVAHMHNVRVMWLKAAKVDAIPEQLDRHSVTREEALVGLAASRDAMLELLRTSLLTTGKVKNSPPDVAHFLAYQIAHDAHHRGQVCMLARQLGHKLPKEVEFGMWEFGKRSKEVAVPPAAVESR